MQQNTLQQENRFVNLMTQLSEEKQHSYINKRTNEHKAKAVAEMAREKIKELQTELEARGQFYDSKISTLESEN